MLTFPSKFNVWVSLFTTLSKSHYIRLMSTGLYKHICGRINGMSSIGEEKNGFIFIHCRFSHHFPFLVILLCLDYIKKPKLSSFKTAYKTNILIKHLPGFILWTFKPATNAFLRLPAKHTFCIKNFLQYVHVCSIFLIKCQQDWELVFL